MAKNMALKHAVLGLVAERPSYGYQLAQRLEERFPSGGWERSGVYGALDSLEREGYVEGVGEGARGETGRGPPRKGYRVTEPGREFFREWVLAPSPFSPSRQMFDLKLQLAGPDLWPALTEQALGQETYCMAELKELTDAEKENPPGQPSTWAQASAVLRRNAEIKLLEARIEWLQEARQMMTTFLSKRDRSAV
jgi:DNA-binding PadR family transcriptional regulator